MEAGFQVKEVFAKDRKAIDIHKKNIESKIYERSARTVTGRNFRYTKLEQIRQDVGANYVQTRHYNVFSVSITMDVIYKSRKMPDVMDMAGMELYYGFYVQIRQSEAVKGR